MGWITRAPSGRWKATYRDPDRHQRSRTFLRKADAERWLRAMEATIDRGTWVDPGLGRTTLEEFFFQHYLPSAVHLRPKTVETYRALATKHILPRLGARPLDRISRLDVETWLAQLLADGVGPARAAAAFRVLRLVLGAAERADFIPRNPARGVKAPRSPRREMRFLTPEEVDRIADAVPPRYRALVYLLAYCGLRIGEAIALRVENLDLLRRRVRVVEAASELADGLVFGPTKTGRNRSVSIPRFVAEELARHLEAFPPVDGRVFSNSAGQPIRQTTFNRSVWTPAVRRAGLEPPLPRVHDLRHTAAALAIAAGAHPKEIQARLGHSSITVTLDRYGHLLPGLDEALAGRLDDIGRDTSGRRTLSTMRANASSQVRSIRSEGDAGV